MQVVGSAVAHIRYVVEWLEQVTKFFARYIITTIECGFGVGTCWGRLGGSRGECLFVVHWCIRRRGRVELFDGITIQVIVDIRFFRTEPTVDCTIGGYELCVFSEWQARGGTWWPRCYITIGFIRLVMRCWLIFKISLLVLCARQCLKAIIWSDHRCRCRRRHSFEVCRRFGSLLLQLHYVTRGRKWLLLIANNVPALSQRRVFVCWYHVCFLLSSQIEFLLVLIDFVNYVTFVYVAFVVFEERRGRHWTTIEFIVQALSEDLFQQ